MRVHLCHVLPFEKDFSVCYGIVRKTHDSHEKRGLARSVGAEEYMGLPLFDIEVDVVKHLFFTDIYMEIFDMQHTIIEECMSMSGLNAFHIGNCGVPVLMCQMQI
jgi:hypothetical protein